MKLKVLTLNAAHGVPSVRIPLPFLVPRRVLHSHLDAMAGLLAREAADVVALQEMDRAGLFSGREDPLERLAGRAGYPHLLHGPHFHLPGVCARGTALLSRRPLLEPEWSSFGADRAIDKGYVVAAVDGGGGRLLDVVSVHLDPFSEARRLRQVARLVEALRRRPLRPRMVLGDLNSHEGNPGGIAAWLMRELELHAHAPASGEPTYPARRPRERLDWLLVPAGLRFVSHRTLSETVSDHLAVAAELAWEDAPATTPASG